MSNALRLRLLRHLARRYQAGATLDKLAPLFGCSARTLAARLRELGVTIRPPGRPRTVTIVGLAALGFTEAEIARRLGVSREAVTRALHRYPDLTG